LLRHDSQIGGAQVNGNNTDRPEGDGDGMLVPLTIGMRGNLGKDAARKGAAMWRAVTNRYPKAIFMICLLGYDEDPREAWRREQSTLAGSR